MNLLLDEIPLSCYDKLRDFTDARFFNSKFFSNIEYFNLAKEEAIFSTNTSYILSLHHLEGETFNWIEKLHPTHLVLPSIEGKDPETNIVDILHYRDSLSFRGFRIELLLPWKGELRHLRFLMTLGTGVSLHWKDNRQLYVSSDPERWNYAKQFTYLGFRNLDELRRLTPGSLITSLPIKAAVNSIDLKDRERRPKKLMDLDYLKLPINSETLQLIINNIQAIKEATNV